MRRSIALTLPDSIRLCKTVNWPLPLDYIAMDSRVTVLTKFNDRPTSVYYWNPRIAACPFDPKSNDRCTFICPWSLNLAKLATSKWNCNLMGLKTNIWPYYSIITTHLAPKYANFQFGLTSPLRYLSGFQLLISTSDIIYQLSSFISLFVVSWWLVKCLQYIYI